MLLIGYGNPAREDDGLGPAAVEAMREYSDADVTIDADYQLTVEDSEAVSQHDVVIFVDAAIDGSGPFYFKRVQPLRQESFSSHSVSPEAVLGLAQDLFQAGAAAYKLGIRGYSFEMFCERITDGACANMQEAVRFLERLIRTRDFSQAACPPE